jgi:hypothetical protein
LSTIAAATAASIRWSRFTDSMDFCQRMVRMGAALEHASTRGVNIGDLSLVEHADLYRMAWHQAVAGLDYWLHQEIIGRAVEIISDPSVERPAQLQGFSISFRSGEAMQSRPSHEVMGELITERLRLDSYQKADRIAKGLGLVTNKGRDLIWEEVAATMGPPWNANKVKAQQNAIADRRNKIAHEVDIDPGTGRRRSISRGETEEVVAWITTLAGAILAVLG